jgi:gliding-associated putative ABC transporter substrate-binding component GldG
MKFLNTIPGQTLIAVLVVLAVNFISFQSFFRIDMTEDQRYSVSPETTNILESLEDDVEIELFFDGSSSADYQQLYKAVIETIEEMEIDAQYGFNYTIDNPNLITNDTTRQKRYQQLLRTGVKYIALTTNIEGKEVKQAVFAGGLVHYQGRFYPISFIREGSGGKTVNFDQSVNEIEYELVTALSIIKDEFHKRIAYSMGHGELDPRNTASIDQELVKYGDVGYIDITLSPSIDSIDLLIVAQPKKPFSELDKYKLDQYVLKGGNVMYFLDEMTIRKDTITRDKFVSLPYQHNLRNLMRQYGLRLQGDMVFDYSCEQQVFLNENDNQEPLKMPFYPLLRGGSDHPIVEDLNPVVCNHAGTIDTVKALGSIRTPLLATSKYTKVLGGDLITYSWNEIHLAQQESYYSDGPQVVAYLCEGKFKSLYANRPKPIGVQSSGFLKESRGEGKVILVADGDIIRNSFDNRNQRPIPLGSSLFTKGEQYANSTFIMNTANYLLGNAKIVNLKSKEIVPRQLDGFLYDEPAEKNKWRMINLALPILVILSLSMIRSYLRKNKFTK